MNKYLNIGEMVKRYRFNRDETKTAAAAAAAKSLQSCPTLCDPTDGSPPGSTVPGILQARTLEWVAISFSIAWEWKVKVKSLSHAWLFTIPWTAAHQAPPSMGFSRQEYWSGLPLPSPETKTKIIQFMERETYCPSRQHSMDLRYVFKYDRKKYIYWK